MWRSVLVIVALVAALVGVLIYSQVRQEPAKASGFIEAHVIRVGSRVGGRVAEVHVAEGQTVKRGDKLVTLEPYDLQEQRAAAEAALTSRVAALELAKAGFRIEEIAQARARRDQLAARLKELEAGPRAQEIAEAVAQLEAAEAVSKLAGLTFEHKRELRARGAATQDELERATQELNSARASAEAARQRLELLRAGTRAEAILQAKAQVEEAEQAWKLRQAGYRPQEVAQAEAARQAAEADLNRLGKQIQELTVTAPVDGVIEAVDLRPGDMVAPQAPVLSIVDVSALWVRAYVPENRLDLQVGREIQVTTDSHPGERFKARITFVARQAEFTPGNVQTPEERSKQVFRIKATLVEGLDRLRPGMSADVWLGAAGAR